MSPEIELLVHMLTELPKLDHEARVRIVAYLNRWVADMKRAADSAEEANRG